MKSFKHFMEASELDAKRLEMQKNVFKSDFKNKIEIKRDKRKAELAQRIDQLEKDLPDDTADEVVRRLKKG